MENEPQRCIDNDLTRLTSSVTNLCLERNTLVPISRLPTEILADIFVHCVRNKYKSIQRLPICLPEWVHVSYVCRQWRDVALDCPTFWSYVFLLSPRWTEELLARSKQVPLKIFMGRSHPVKTLALQSLKRVVDYGERIQELHLFLPLWGDEVLRPFLGLSSPRLQALEIHTDSSFFMKGRIFDGKTPSLRKLDLADISMPWYSFQLSNLISLSVENSFHPFRPTMVELLSTLRLAHDLVHLRLYNALHDARSFLADVDSNSVQRINLPQLSDLSISAPLSTVVAFLYCVNMSPKTKMMLSCSDEVSTTLDDYSRLSSILAQKFRLSEDQAPSLPAIRSLIINFNEAEFVFSTSEYGCGRTLYQGKIHWTYDGHDIILQLSIKFKRTVTGQERVHVLGDICHSVCLAKDIQTDSIYGYSCPSNFWESSLRPFQELKYLNVSVCKTSDLALALSLIHPDDMENQDGYISQGSRLLCAPGLEELELGCMIYGTDFDEQDIHDLRTALSIRKAQGRALKRCIFSASSSFDPSPEIVSGLPVDEVWVRGKRSLESH